MSNSRYMWGAVTKWMILIYTASLLSACGGGSDNNPFNDNSSGNEAGATDDLVELPPNEAPIGHTSRKIADDLVAAANELDNNFLIPNEQVLARYNLNIARVLVSAIDAANKETQAIIDKAIQGQPSTAEMMVDVSGTIKEVKIDKDVINVYERVIQYLQEQNNAGVGKGVFSSTQEIKSSQFVCSKVGYTQDVLAEADKVLGGMCVGAAALPTPLIDEAVACGALALNQNISLSVLILDILCQVLPIYVDSIVKQEFVEYFTDFGVMFEKPCLRQVSAFQVEPDKMEIEVHATLANKIKVSSNFKELLSLAIERKLRWVGSVSETLKQWLSNRLAEAILLFLKQQADITGISVPDVVGPISTELLVPPGLIRWEATADALNFDGNTMKSNTYRGKTSVIGIIESDMTTSNNAITINAGEVSVSGPPLLVNNDFASLINSWDAGSVTYSDVDRDIYYMFVMPVATDNTRISQLVTGGWTAGVQTEDEITLSFYAERYDLKSSGEDKTATFARDKCGNWAWTEHNFTYERYCSSLGCFYSPLLTITILTNEGIISNWDAIKDYDNRHSQTWYGEASYFPQERYRYKQ